MAQQNDNVSIKSGSTFPRCSYAQSVTSHYTQPLISVQRIQTEEIQHSHPGSFHEPQRAQTELGPGTPSIAPSDTTLVGSPSSKAERHWSNDGQGSGGVRSEVKTRRGIYTSPGELASRWRETLENIMHYSFQNPDLLEEALESYGSGVVVVGSSHRICTDGNEGLARVGNAVMKLALRDQCYLFKFNEKDATSIVERMIDWSNLNKIGKKTQIEQMIRPRAPVRPTKRHNIFSLMADDAKRDPPNRMVTKAIRAIIGAVYYDGVFEAARRVMCQLELIIKP